MAKKFKGIGCPCVTPFTKDGLLDLIHLRELVDYLINNEVKAILPASRCGEAYSLTISEYREIIDTVIDQVNAAVPVYVGLPPDCFAQTVDIANYATDVGADGFLISSPRLPTLSEQEVEAYFSSISSKIDNNLLVLNDPDYTSVDLSVDLLLKLTDLSNIVGVVECSSDFNKLSAIRSKIDDDFAVFAGRGLFVPQALTKAQATGAIVPSANIVPDLLGELYEAHNLDMKDRFDELQTKMIPLEIGLKLGTSPVAIKACLNLLGIQVGLPRCPILPLPEKDLEKLKNILIECGCLPPPVESEDSTESSEETQIRENNIYE
ncbi:MAG: hypothetical protein GF308_19835 [Candidatus Heimdallarchaeota archaeon]|nr:hypothetical protein [Candidatus Heimdallarchaeota archaeon]